MTQNEYSVKSFAKPHPLRCEKCMNTDCYYCPPSEISQKIVDEEMQDAWVFTSEMGCASHSSAPSAEQRIEEIKDAIILNEVVVELREIVDNFGEDNPVSQAYIAVLEMIRVKKIVKSFLRGERG